MANDTKHSSAKERGKRLRLIRKMSGLTLDDLSSRYNFGVSTIKYWECAKNRGLSAKGAEKIITAMHNEGLQCSYAWLMHGVGLPPQFINVHYHKGNRDSINVDSVYNEEEKFIEHEMAAFCKNVSGSIALTVFDDGMEPFYSVNDGVGGRRLHGNELTKAIGKNCIVETVDNKLLCRRLAQGNGNNKFNLYCINYDTKAAPPNVYDIELLSAAPISRIWKRK